jgi:acetylornithine deacetylase/succinyl-diaminopimelate desuccinylase-like protein
MGLSTQLHETARHPVVVAMNQHRPDRRTVLIYGHYDVQPADPYELWHSPPFEPRVTDGIIYARGAMDNKGQFMAHLVGVQQTLRQAGDLPVNLIFLIEGEEEIGSPNLPAFLQQQRETLACDIIAVSDTGMVDAGVPTFTYGLRGIACAEITLTGPSLDLHSGIFGGAVANPNTELARLIAKVHDEHGRIQIDGFYDDVRSLADWERQAWAQLPTGEAQTRHLTGVPALHGEAGYTDTERRWARPTAEVNGLGGGYQGAGSKTVIPSRAFAKFSFRLVPDQDPEKILQQVESWFKKNVPPSVNINVELGHSGPPYLTDPQSSYGQAAQRALRRTFHQEPALIREGGSIPIVQTFQNILKADTLLLGLANPDGQAHAPNENFPIVNYEAGQKLNQSLLEELAK